MNKFSLESILNAASESEKKRNWIQASDYYRKAQNLALEQKNILLIANLYEKIGFCFYRIAFQAQDNIEFKKNIKKAISKYQEEYKLFEERKNDNQIKIKHVKSLIFYTKSWLEQSLKKRKKLLDEWWILETEVLSFYEKNNDNLDRDRIYFNLLEGSIYYRFWIHTESPGSQKVLIREGFKIAEKAIQLFSKLNKEYELALAYCFAIWYIGFGSFFLASKNEIKSLQLKSFNYLNNAFKITKKIPDKSLLAWVYFAAGVSASSSKHDYVLAIEHINKSIKYAIISRDNFLICYGKGLKCLWKLNIYPLLEDPDKQRTTLEGISKLALETLDQSRIINHRYSIFLGYNQYSTVQTKLASIEPDLKTKTSILKKTNRLLLKGTEEFKDWKKVSGSFFGALTLNYYYLSDTIQNPEEKKKFLQKALFFGEEHLSFQKKSYSTAYHGVAETYYRLALIKIGLEKIEPDISQRILLLEKTINYLNRCIDFSKKDREIRSENPWTSGIIGQYYTKLGKILQKLHSLAPEKKIVEKAKESYHKAIVFFKNTDLPTHMAESYWNLAKLHDQNGEFEESSRYYQLASQEYNFALKKIPQLKDFYNEYSLYMQAWNEIENAKFYHIREDYSKSKKYYENAGIIHKKLDNWSYLSSNYFAWAKMEQAEEYSRTENPRKAIDNFQDANEYFQKTEHKIKNNILKNLTTEETNSLTQILRDSNNRQRYCQARILMEKARLLERDGKYLDSSKSYEKAAQSISFIVEKIENEEEHKELKYIEILCQAWKKMTNAEATTSAELYFDAAELFEEAKDYCFTKKASLWALGNSNFCKGLAAGVKYQITLDLDEHNKAKSFIKSASTNYLSAGFRNASEYAKATQRLFDAYLYINKAETESNQEIRAKHYQIVETLLQITSDSFIKAKQPKKAAKVQDILINVREEKELAISLSQVMKAPNIASTTTSFVAPSPINEVSVGLEKFEHANIQANLVTTHKQVKIGESFCLSLEFVNAGREPALLMKVEDFIPPEFLIVKNPEIYRIDKTALNMKGKQLAPLKLVEVKLTLQSLKKGKYKLNPKVHYLDELGQNKILLLKTLEITIEEIVLENRIATGTAELDSLLFGGFPNEYSIVLAGSPSDEREYLVKNFLEAGIRKDEIVFHVSTEMHDLEDFLKDSNFSLFVCNPKPKNKIPNQSNVYRLRSKTDLTNLSISIAKAYRNIDKSKKKRICIENVSNILLDYEAKATCKWVSELIADLSSKGFTMLFVMDPTMHPSDQAKAVINLFDGEINITQTEDPLECKKSIIVKKLRNQEYIKNPICLT